MIVYRVERGCVESAFCRKGSVQLLLETGIERIIRADCPQIVSDRKSVV